MTTHDVNDKLKFSWCNTFHCKNELISFCQNIKSQQIDKSTLRYKATLYILKCNRIIKKICEPALFFSEDNQNPHP